MSLMTYEIRIKILGLLLGIAQKREAEGLPIQNFVSEIAESHEIHQRQFERLKKMNPYSDYYQRKLSLHLKLIEKTLDERKNLFTHLIEKYMLEETP